MRADRRDFLKKTGSAVAAASTASLWPDLLLAEEVPTTAEALFETRFGVSRGDMGRLLSLALGKGGEFAELFFEYKIANGVTMEEDIVKESSERVSLGVGIRVLKGEQTGYGYTSDLTFEGMSQAARTAAAIASEGGRVEIAPLRLRANALQVYDLERPFAESSLSSRMSLLRQTYDAAQAYHPKIEKVRVSLRDEIQYVLVANSEGLLASDTRPQVRLIASVTAADGGNRSTGLSTAGGRVGSAFFSSARTPKELGREAAEEAIVLLGAVSPRPGDQTVVLDSGQSGVMIHEAVGHPLEADSNRKKRSVFWDKLNQTVANPLVTIYDDPTIAHFRGSHNMDDEGTLPRKTMLIEKGKLVGYLQDRLSAKLMKMSPSGHGRRDGFENVPLPRMANTNLARGESDPEQIVRSVKRGFFAKTYQGGMVQPSGKFTFSVNMGYLIEDGKLTAPVKNATLIGSILDVLPEVTMVGNDMGTFLGTCGKGGQSAPVTAGTPTLKINSMTVGGRS
jgi:TldD protein